MDKISQVPDMLNKLKMSGYRRTSQESYDDESLLSEQKAAGSESSDGAEAGGIPRYEESPRPQRPWLKYTLFAVGFVLYSFLLATYAPRPYSEKECVKQTSLYSPMNEAVEYREFDFDTAFDADTKYRGPPTAELEAAWDELWNVDPIAFPEDKLSAVNRTGGVLGDHKLARLDDGEGDVAATLELFHSIHCLNYIRQYTWRDWYFDHPDKVVIPRDMLASDVGVRIHADHCIDFLRTTLMCHGDTTVFFTVIDPEEPMGARGDFNAHHKCRDFGKLQEWAKENGQNKFQSFHSHDG